MAGAPRTPIDVDVTPVNQSGDIVICDLDPTPGGGGGGHVVDGVICLPFAAPAANNFRINFRLRPGPLGQYNWAGAAPFWARRSRCPTVAGVPPQFPAQGVAGGILTVDADRVAGPGQSGVHFRLNLTDPGGNQVYCDPIIING